MWSTSMIKRLCAVAGFATGALIGMLLQLWLIVTGDHGMPPPTVGEALLAGLGFGAFAALLVALLATLAGRLRLRSLILPVLLVALLTGMISGLIGRIVSPALVVALLAPLIGYLIGLLFCWLCERGVLPWAGAGR